MTRTYIKNLTSAAIIAATLTIGAGSLFAWTSAPPSPPNGNIDAPVNVGVNPQIKSGSLEVNGFRNDGTSYFVGNVGIGTNSPGYKLQVGNVGDGSSIGTNSFFYISDARLKANVATISDALDKVMQLRGVTFDWKSTGKPDVGVIAQEVEKVFPDLVTTDMNGIKSVKEGNLVAPLIEAVKAQQAEIEQLKAEVAALKAAQK